MSKTCPYCKSEIPDDAKVCPECNESLVRTCPYCGEEIHEQAIKCKHCGEKLTPKNELNNVANKTEMPKELEKFNWGVFLCSWIWGCFNNMPKNVLIIMIVGSVIMPWIPFMCFLSAPALLVALIWAGTQGNKWAWANKKWESIEQFNNYQRKWVWIPILVFFLLVIIGILILAILSSIFGG